MQIIGKILGSLFMIAIGSLGYLSLRYPEKMAKFSAKGRFYGEVAPTELYIFITRITGGIVGLISVGMILKIWFSR